MKRSQVKMWDILKGTENEPLEKVVLNFRDQLLAQGIDPGQSVIKLYKSDHLRESAIPVSKMHHIKIKWLDEGEES